MKHIVIKIKNKEDILNTEKYYSREYERCGNKHLSYYNLYDDNFNITRSVSVLFTNSIEHLTRIVDINNKEDISLIPYDLIPLNENFMMVNKNTDTSEYLKDICNSVKPKNWR